MDEIKNIGLYSNFFILKVDCKMNPSTVRKKRPASFKMVFATNPCLGTDLLSSITYLERIKIETFCELGLSNIQMADWLNRSPANIFMNCCDVNLIRLNWPKQMLNISGHDVAVRLN